MDEFNLQQKKIIELLQSQLASLNEAFKTLDEKAEQNISVNSIILALVGGFNLFKPGAGQSQTAFEPLEVFAILGIYAVVLILSFISKSPKEHATYPMKPTWEEAMKWNDLNESDFYDKLVASYADVIELNNRIIKQKALFVQLGTIFIALDVLVIFLVVAL